MPVNLVWSAAMALEAALLLRAARTRLLKQYFLFYSYIGTVLTVDLIRLSCQRLPHDSYITIYWATELVTIVASYAVIIEIFRQSVRHNPGTAVLTRTLLLVVFVLTVTFVCLDLSHGGFSSLDRTVADTGRYFRNVEGALLLVMLWLLARYGIRLGRNLLGLTAGNAFWIGVSILNLGLWSLPGNELSVLLRRMQPTSYLITLAVWSATLWSVQAEPVQPAENKIERDYQYLAARTRAALARTSDLLVRTNRP
jgi:hypothetical protein